MLLSSGLSSFAYQWDSYFEKTIYSAFFWINLKKTSKINWISSTLQHTLQYQLSKVIQSKGCLLIAIFFENNKTDQVIGFKIIYE